MLWNSQQSKKAKNELNIKNKMIKIFLFLKNSKLGLPFFEFFLA